MQDYKPNLQSDKLIEGSKVLYYSFKNNVTITTQILQKNTVLQQNTYLHNIATLLAVRQYKHSELLYNNQRYRVDTPY